MKRYNPETSPDPHEWLSLDEEQRISLVQASHRQARIKLPNARLHAMMHAVVENQLALGVSEVCAALARLQFDGLDRHDAIHAIGQVLLTTMYEGLKEPVKGEINASYLSELETLTAQKWLNQEFD